MKNSYEVLKKPVITEKSTVIKEAGNVVTFVVDKSASKTEIKASVEENFKVEVGSVRTVNVAGKCKRTKGGMGKRSNWKKAYVQLKDGESIDIFEGV